MERWKSVDDFPTYEVSDEGRIRNVKTGRVLKKTRTSKGYEQVSLRKDKQQHVLRVHRLIADTFYGEHDDLDVNHIDGDKLNNKLSNLEFCTRKENINHAFRTGLKQPSRMKKVRVIETGVVYNSIRECARQIGVDQSMICQCLTGRQKTTHGYSFERVD